MRTFRNGLKWIGVGVIWLTVIGALASCRVIGVPNATQPPPLQPTVATVPTGTLEPPPAPATAPSPRAAVTATPTKVLRTPTRVAPTPPSLARMSFAERNTLYHQLLRARQAEGRDTSAAEEEYAQAIELMFAGNFSAADVNLNQAITALLP